MSLVLKSADVEQAVGKELGVSEWYEMTQDGVNAFADLTVDHQFIHIDPERAAKTPFGGPIAHGFYTLSMLTYFMENGCGLLLEDAKMGVNYGFDKIRFIQPVRVGKRVRGSSKLLSVEEKKPGQFLFKQEVSVEIEGEEKPALIAEWLTMMMV